MNSQTFSATYLIETPMDPARVAEVMAGEQSCGTFTRVQGETAELRARARARVESVELLESVATPSLPNAWLARQAGGMPGQYQRARVRIAFPVASVAANLATLAAAVAVNL